MTKGRPPSLGMGLNRERFEGGIFMSRFAKISSIGCDYKEIDPSLDMREAVEAMKEHLRGKLSRVLPDRPDLIVLPEVCDMPRSFTGERLKAFYACRGDSILTMMRETAKKHSCYIAYPRLRQVEDGTWRNSVELIGRDGEIVGIYNKNHPVDIEISVDGVLGGKDAPVLQCDFGTVAFVICFDLNFDRLREMYVKAKPDLLVFVSMYHGGLMQQYWAYSCGSFFVSAISQSYPSQLISPLGQVLRTNTNYFDSFTEKVNLDYVLCHLNGHWEKLTAMKEKYGEQVRIVEPGYVGAVQISSESESLTVQQLVQEYELETFSDYLKRSLEFQCLPGNIEP
ncbi:carbon-nitrogen hydrolase family protein [Paenibacillus contaminans]|uniref:Carbon-nitrogen hydrolase family protein n=2 Tax=Paenibacillus contaminans TaxID=450362 RepID=A0A329MRN6_9BACL|nr:carbon-nitrogen hydrolase family protein [Paenibacillus contaminans]